MKFKMSPESAIRCVKLLLYPIQCWPPPLSASKSDLFNRDIILAATLILPVMVIYPVIDTIIMSRKNVVNMTKNFSTLIAISFAIIKMIMCRYHRARFQIYYAEMEEFIKNANSRERALLERYMDRCGLFYTLVGLFSIATLFCYSIGPVMLPQPLPTEVDFPFAYEDSPTRITLLYILEVIYGCEAVSAVFVDMEIALLLWVRGIKFELLAADFMMADSLSELNECIKKHQQLIHSTSDIVSTVRYIVFAVTTMTCLGNICTGYQFVVHQPIAALAQFIFMFIVMSTEVLMYAWPADNLMAVSKNIAYAAYSSPWVGKSPEQLTNIQIVMARAQKPLVMSIGGILPELDLEFYGKYLVTSFSYITTLKTAFG